MKVKLLIVINQLYKGGAEQSLVNLLANLDADKYEVDLLVYDHYYVPSAISLLSQLPGWVRVCHAAQSSKLLSVCHKGALKVLEKITYEKRYYRKARTFVREQEYDIAISYGEWFIPDFIVKFVKAKKRAIWIHNDLSLAEYFDANAFFRYDEAIDFYIFVSSHSKQDALDAYPFLQNKAVLIHNTVNDREVIKKAAEPLAERACEVPVVVTVNNIRTQKNHLRQIEAMALLKKRGIAFQWWNIGSTIDKGLTRKVKKSIQKHDLENEFILLGTRENPYQYIKQADVVAVLSDYESWSLVITEAKILGKAILATPTSGALEQLEPEKTGIICDFSAEDIALKLEDLLKNSNLRKKLQGNLQSFRSGEVALGEFENFIQEALLARKVREKSSPNILFIIDNLNYQGGAHNACKEQIAYLISKGAAVSVFSESMPTVETRNTMQGCRFTSFFSIPYLRVIPVGVRSCLFSSFYAPQEQWLKLKIWFAEKMKLEQRLVRLITSSMLREYFQKFDHVCVMSEGSKYRAIVSELDVSRKTQWIHTDYEHWSQFNAYTKQVTLNDEAVYKGFKKIVFVSEKSKQGFLKKFPQHTEKCIVIKNIIPVDKIKKWAKEERDRACFSIVSVGRLEPEKAVERSILVAKRLKEDGLMFRWEFIGDGYLKKDLETLIQSLHLEKQVVLAGYKKNPYSSIKSADLFALFSYYEGLPNTVYEALILGVPVAATRVGGIAEQLEHGVTGWLIDNDEESIYQELKKIVANKKVIADMKNNLKKYKFDVEKIHRQLDEIFEIEGYQKKEESV